MTSRSREENRDYMRDYMRGHRKRSREADRARKRAEYKSEAPDIWSKADFVDRRPALYDPLRDGPLHHADLTAWLMRDPPIGRRAIDQHQARTSVRSISLAGER
ncbi:hypothetical protein [Bradyrhizobium sp. YR681]|uniref:hypothetical protein n=1 Tax=Bradyrhizobium sp. YR681 TaxID=1144344 RepID=UPI0012F6DE3B|nr:hypothetical protein [Bradyrhizobium sp. YR681]